MSLPSTSQCMCESATCRWLLPSMNSWLLSTFSQWDSSDNVSVDSLNSSPDYHFLVSTYTCAYNRRDDLMAVYEQFLSPGVHPF